MSRVWVKSVAPNNLHGFRADQLILDGLEEGLNVVFASNATGKSTLAKAIVNLFQPEQLDSDATINGVIWSGKEFLSLARRRREEKFGGFPGRTKDYFLDLQSLLQGLKQDAYVQELLANGFKFSEPVKQSAVDNNKDVKAVREQLQGLKDARKRKQALLSDEQKLPQLAQMVAEAEEARSNFESLETLSEQVRLHARVGRLRNGLGEATRELPGIELLVPTQHGEVERRLNALQKLQSEVSEVAEALNDIGGDSVPSRILADPDRVRLELCIEELKRLRAILERNRQAYRSAMFRADQERNLLFRIEPGVNLENLPAVAEPVLRDLSRIAALADEEREWKTRTEGLRAASSDWKADEAFDPIELEKVQRRLIEWLQLEETSSSSKPKISIGVLALAAMVSIALPAVFERLIVLVLGIAAAAYLYARESHEVQTQEKPSLSGLPQPFNLSSPNPAEVTELLNRIALLRAGRATADKLRAMAEAGGSPPEDWREISKGLGLHCDDPYRLRIVFESISEYQKAVREVSEIGEDVSEQERREVEILGEIGGIYEDYGFSMIACREVESFGDFVLWFKTAKQRSAKEEELSRETVAMERLLDSQGIPVEEDLASRAQRFFDRLPTAKEVQRTIGEINLIAAKLDCNSAPMIRAAALLQISSEENVLELPLDRIGAEIETQKRLSGELETRRARHQDLLLQIRQAEESGSVEALELTYRSGLSKVEARWETACRDSVSFRVGEAIRERLMTEDLPPVLQAANNRLASFSLSRYRLEFSRSNDESLGVVTVNDLREGRSQPFQTLSSGTKVHVLLALRLALIEEQEKLTSGGELKFPLLVDEAMALSDPESSRAIAESIVGIAAERQVIVFTSQGSDVGLLRSLVPHLRIRSLNRELPLPNFVESGLERTLIAPSSHHFDPRVPVGAHSGFAVFGPTTPFGGRRLDQIRLDARTEMMVSGLEHARKDLVDRYPRLNWADCSEQRWAQTAFSIRLQEFLDECGGCPHRFKDALEANRSHAFNRVQLDSATEWLDENNYLIPPAPVESITEVVAKHLDPNCVDFLEPMVRLFAVAFIPHFDREEWNLGANALVERESRIGVRRTRKPEPVPIVAGLFDDMSGN